MYRSPFGNWQLDESGRELSLQRAIKGLAPDGLARYLLAAAKPGNALFRDDFANLLNGVSIAPEGVVRLQLARVHVRPEALLQIPPPTAAGRFSVAELFAGTSPFRRNVNR